MVGMMGYLDRLFKENVGGVAAKVLHNNSNVAHKCSSNKHKISSCQ